MLADRRAIRLRPLQNLSKAGKPLLARYDLDAVAARLSREALALAPAGMWKWRELLPLPEGAEPVSLGEPETPLIPLDHVARKQGTRAPIVKDEGRLPTGSFKARGMAAAVSMARHFGVTRIALPTNGNAGAALAAYAARAGMESLVICPAETPEINIRETAAYGAEVIVADGQIDECGRIVGEGAAAGPLVRLLDPEGALPARGQEGDGAGAGRAVRLGAAGRRSSIRPAAAPA